MKYIIRIIAVLALVGAVLGTCATEGHAALPSNCRYVGYTNAFASVGEQIDLGELLATQDRFSTRKCVEAGLRIQHFGANTLEETRGLRNLVRDSNYGRRFGLPLVFCRTSFVTGYMMGSTWLFNTTRSPDRAERTHWRKFAARWVNTHDWCRLGL